MWQLKESLKPLFLCLSVLLNGWPIVCPTNHCRDGNDDDVDQFVPSVIPSWIIQAGKVLCDTRSAVFCHRSPPILIVIWRSYCTPIPGLRINAFALQPPCRRAWNARYGMLGYARGTNRFSWPAWGLLAPARYAGSAMAGAASRLTGGRDRRTIPGDAPGVSFQVVGERRHPDGPRASRMLAVRREIEGNSVGAGLAHKEGNVLQKTVFRESNSILVRGTFMCTTRKSIQSTKLH